jgi:predicted neuraminidase
MAIQIERVFGPETPTGKYKHPASFTELANGDLYLVWYGGEGEYATDTAVWGTRRRKGQTTWSPPRVLARDPFRSVGNAVIWQAPDDVVWLFYVNRFGETWSTSRILGKISRDGAETWSDAFVVATEAGMMVRSRPIVLLDGDYLLPIYDETGSDTELVPPDSTSLFLRWDTKKKRWSETNRVHSRIGNIQPAVAQIDEKYLVAYCRRGGDYSGRPDGWVVRTESRDGGHTWSEGRDSQFPNPNAAVDFIRLRNGHLLLVYNDSHRSRTPLTVAISADNDRTYPHRRNIGEGPGSFAYPTVLQSSDGKIHVIYTTDQRTVIRHAVFEESDIT